MSYSQREFHNFIIRAALHVQNIYEAIIEQDERTIKYYATYNNQTKYEMRKRYIMMPEYIDMNYLYQGLDKLVGEKLNRKAVNVW